MTRFRQVFHCSSLYFLQHKPFPLLGTFTFNFPEGNRYIPVYGRNLLADVFFTPLHCRSYLHITEVKDRSFSRILLPIGYSKFKRQGSLNMSCVCICMSVAEQVGHAGREEQGARGSPRMPAWHQHQVGTRHHVGSTGALLFFACVWERAGAGEGEVV